MAAASAASFTGTPCSSDKDKEKTTNEQAAGPAASGDPPQTSSPAESSIRAASVNFSFASPVAEEKTDDAMEGVSDPQLSPEDLRQQQEDPPSLTMSQNEEIVRDDYTEPILENVTIQEEVLKTDQRTASEETESPGLDFESVLDLKTFRRRLYFNAGGMNKHHWVQQSKWFQMNMLNGVPRETNFNITPALSEAADMFLGQLMRCKKPKLFKGSSREEPCNSPAYECCLCSQRTSTKK